WAPADSVLDESGGALRRFRVRGQGHVDLRPRIVRRQRCRAGGGGCRAPHPARRWPPLPQWRPCRGDCPPPGLAPDRRIPENAALRVVPCGNAMQTSLDERKDRARRWFEELRDRICAAFERLEDEAETAPSPQVAGMAAGRFARTGWR